MMWVASPRGDDAPALGYRWGVKALEITFAAIMLFGAIWGLTRSIQGRRRAARAAMGPAAPASEPVLPGALAGLGFTEPIQSDDGLAGARGVFDGVVIQAFGVHERSPMGSATILTFAVPHPDGVRRLRVSATAQGMRRARGALVLGLPAVDTRLDVTGDAAEARELFSRRGADGLVKAITTRGWTLTDGLLVRPGLSEHHLREVALAGAAAAKVLHA